MNKSPDNGSPPSDPPSPHPTGLWDPTVECAAAGMAAKPTLENWLSIAYPDANSLDDLDGEQQAEVPWELLEDEPPRE